MSDSQPIHDLYRDWQHPPAVQPESGHCPGEADPAVVAGPATSHFGRQVLESIICLTIAVLLFRAFGLEGYIISTGSMAPNLLGYHKRVQCPDCGYRYPYGVAFDRELPASQFSRCPNCFQSSIDVSDVPRNDGDQLLVFKHAYALRDPRRWEVVVFQNPANPVQAYVKRVVGLPGETLQVIDGDVYINGRIARKSLQQQRAIRIPVFDQDFCTTTDDRQPRWLPERGWAASDHAFLRSLDDADDYAWVSYRQVANRGKSPRSGGRFAPVTDCYGYNRIDGMDEQNSVHDLMLSARVDWPRSGTFAAQLQARDQRVLCEFNLDRTQLRVWIIEPQEIDSALAGELPPVATSGFSNIWRDSEIDLDVSYCDQRIIVAVNNEILVSHDVEDGPSISPQIPPSTGAVDAGQLVQNLTGAREHEGVAHPTFRLRPDVRAEIAVAGYSNPETAQVRPMEAPSDSGNHNGTGDSNLSPVEFGARGGAFRIQSLKLFRDVHYVSEPGQHGVDRPCELANDEFFFLGDNSPVSLDSRGWKQPTVPRRLIIGKPLLVHLPSRQTRVRIGERVGYIRLPDFERMRWIR